MLIHLARLSVITIALALVATLGFLLARPPATVITVVIPQPQAAPAIVQPAYIGWWGGPYRGVCQTRVCW